MIDNSHFGAILCRCEGCGQHFVSIFSELVNWVDGEDPQYWTVLPILDSDVADLEGKGEAELVAYLVAVGSERRALHRHYPKGGEPRSFWRDGLRVV